MFIILQNHVNKNFDMKITELIRTHIYIFKQIHTNTRHI